MTKQGKSKKLKGKRKKKSYKPLQFIYGDYLLTFDFVNMYNLLTFNFYLFTFYLL